MATMPKFFKYERTVLYIKKDWAQIIMYTMEKNSETYQDQPLETGKNKYEISR